MYKLTSLINADVIEPHEQLTKIRDYNGNAKSRQLINYLRSFLSIKHLKSLPHFKPALFLNVSVFWTDNAGV
jgi:hypothetical protein